MRRAIVLLLTGFVVLSTSCALFGDCADGEHSHCDGRTAVTCRTKYSNGQGGSLGGGFRSRSTEDCGDTGCHLECTCTEYDDLGDKTSDDIAVCGPAPAEATHCSC